MKPLTILLVLMSLSASHCQPLVMDDDCLIFPVNPVSYNLTLTLHMNGNQYYYDGEIIMEVFSTIDGVTTIELDARDLVIHKNKVAVYVDNRNIVDRYNPISVTQNKVTIHLREGLMMYSKGGKKYYIHMSFRGNINMADSGLFVTSYKEGNIAKWLISTRLAPNYASSVFPCFDNPHQEAGFIVRVYKPQHKPTSLSVSKERLNSNVSSYTLVEFAPTPQIPCYKMGLHISEFVPHHVPPAQKQGHYLTLWTKRTEINHYYFMLNFGDRILNSFSTYMNWTRPITFAQINVVTIPHYWRSYERGAWNLLTVGESNFLVDNELVSALQKEKMELELTRQLCRVWLGNPDEASKTKWKEDWFKEGMATYFGYYFMVWGDVYQRGGEAFGLQALFRAMAVESKLHMSLSSFNVTSASILSKNEEELITLKTASILRMIEHQLGTDTFHKIVKDYLRSKLHRTISIHDFGEFLQREARHCEFFKGITVSEMIESWVNQAGYPVVNVKAYRNTGVVGLSQHHFNLYPMPPINSGYAIPIAYTTQFTDKCSNCLDPRFTITATSYEYTFKENLNGGWIILNKNAFGYYRVNYEEENWILIANTLNSANRAMIDVANRAQIVNDAFALHVSGLMTGELVTRILSSLQEEEDPAVWDAAFQGFELMKQTQATTKQFYDFWKKFMSDQVSKIFLKVISSGLHDYQSRIFKSKVVNFACSVELPACLSYMGNLQLGPGGRVVDPDVREAYYCVQLKHDDKAWDVLKPYLNTRSVYERDDILNARMKTVNEKTYYEKLNVEIEPGQIHETTSAPPEVKNPSHQKGAATSVSSYLAGLVTVVAVLCLVT